MSKNYLQPEFSEKNLKLFTYGLIVLKTILFSFKFCGINYS